MNTTGSSAGGTDGVGAAAGDVLVWVGSVWGVGEGVGAALHAGVEVRLDAVLQLDKSKHKQTRVMQMRGKVCFVIAVPII